MLLLLASLDVGLEGLGRAADPGRARLERFAAMGVPPLSLPMAGSLGMESRGCKWLSSWGAKHTFAHAAGTRPRPPPPAHPPAALLRAGHQQRVPFLCCFLCRDAPMSITCSPAVCTTVPVTNGAQTTRSPCRRDAPMSISAYISRLPPPPKEQQILVRAIGNNPDWEQPRLFCCVEKTVTLFSLRNGLPGYSFKLRTYCSWSIAAGRGGGHQAGQAAPRSHPLFQPSLTISALSFHVLQAVVEAIKQAKRPVLYIGGGCLDSGGCWAGGGCEDVRVGGCGIGIRAKCVQRLCNGCAMAVQRLPSRLRQPWWALHHGCILHSTLNLR